MSDWTKFATAHYRKTKKSNPSYKFSNALKDAASLYKKGSRSVMNKLRGTKKRVKGGKKRRGGSAVAAVASESSLATSNV